MQEYNVDVRSFPYKAAFNDKENHNENVKGDNAGLTGIGFRGQTIQDKHYRNRSDRRQGLG